MGYSTDFKGVLKLNKQLTEEDDAFIRALTDSRRMKLRVDSKYGVEGEFYVADDLGGWNNKDKVIDCNEPPSTQPGLWCHIVPTDDGEGLEWDGGEKTYSMENWIFYLINRYLAPRGYVVNGVLDAFGEEAGDIWSIKVEDNVVRVATFRNLHDRNSPNWEMTQWEKEKKIPMTVKEPKPKKKVVKKKKEEHKVLISIIRNSNDGEIYLKRSDLCKYIDTTCKGFKKNPVIKATLQLFKDRIMEL
jgi:hypothetical protein